MQTDIVSGGKASIGKATKTQAATTTAQKRCRFDSREAWGRCSLMESFFHRIPFDLTDSRLIVLGQEC